MPASEAVMRSVRTLKRDLLLFQKIHVMGLKRQLGNFASAFGFSELDDATVVDSEFLMDEGILFDAPAFRLEMAQRLSPFILKHGGDDEISYERDAVGDLPAIDQARLLYSTANHPAGRLPIDRVLPLGAEIVVARAEALASSLDVVAVLDGPVQLRAWQDLKHTFIFATPPAGRDAMVTEVVLPHVPIPSDEVSLEALLDFRDEQSTIDQMTSLRLWMARAAISSAPRAELELEVQTMLHEFDQHMKLAGMRGPTSALQLAVALPLGVAEELLHLRPKAALDVVFSRRTAKADQLEALLSSPGSELAYLHTAKHRFD